MEFRRLGGSGFKVPALSMGTVTFGGGNEFFKGWGQSDVAHATRLVDMCLDAGVTMFDSADVYSARPLGRNPRQGARRASPARHHLDQGYIPDGRRTERRRLLTLPPDSRRGREPSQAGHGLHRSLSATRFRSGDPGRGSDRHARRSRSRRQDPLHRLLEFLRLASHEVAGRLRQVRVRALCRPPGLLLARRPRVPSGS